MISKLGRIFVFLMLASTGARAAPTIAQSLVVNFPVNGRVIVQAREEVGKFPQMLFISEKTRRPLLLSSIEDSEKWLIPEEGDTTAAQPSLRFRLIRSRG